MQTHFTIITECMRCHGFPRAFATFGHIESGKCLRCGGSLRDVMVKPIHRIDDYCDGAAQRRAHAIAGIAKVLSLVGVKRVRVGKVTQSAWGFDTWRKGDNERMFAAILSTAPADVRARGWAAFCKKIQATMPEKGVAPMLHIENLLVGYTGVSLAQMSAWLGETETQAVAA